MECNGSIPSTFVIKFYSQILHYNNVKLSVMFTMPTECTIKLRQKSHIKRS